MGEWCSVRGCAPRGVVGGERMMKCKSMVG